MESQHAEKHTTNSSHAVANNTQGKKAIALPAVPVLQNKPVLQKALEENEEELLQEKLPKQLKERETVLQRRFVLQKKEPEEEKLPVQGRFPVQKKTAEKEEQVSQAKSFSFANTPQPKLPVQRFTPQKPIVQKKENKTGLPNSLKEGVENLSGIAMDDVRVRYNSDKPAQLNALAYAQGTDIHIAPGQEKHLPHEAWHVVQQKQGRVKPTLQMKEGVAVNDDKGLEREADNMENSPALRLKLIVSSSQQPNSHQQASNLPIQRFVTQFSLAEKDAEKLKGIFVKWVTKYKKSIFTPYFLSELEGAIIAFYSYKDAYDYLVMVVEKHAEFVGQFQNATLGKKIGKGSEKEVYALADYPDIVIGITTDNNLEGAIARLKEEATLLNELKVEANIPVAEIIGIIEYKGKAATLMYRYAAGSKSTVTNSKDNFNAPVRIGNSANLNATSIEDLNEIMFKFQRKKVRIDDIQFLIGSDGSVVVSDPLSLEIGDSPPTTNMMQMVNRLIETAAENEVCVLLQNNPRAFTAAELIETIKSLGVDPYLVKNVLKGLLINYSAMIKWDSSANTYRYSSFEEVD